MVKKLKGKATKEFKGFKKRQRFRQYEEAKQFLLKYLPLILIGFALIVIYFTYHIMYKS